MTLSGLFHGRKISPSPYPLPSLWLVWTSMTDAMEPETFPRGSPDWSCLFYFVLRIVSEVTCFFSALLLFTFIVEATGLETNPFVFGNHSWPAVGSAINNYVAPWQYISLAAKLRSDQVTVFHGLCFSSLPPFILWRIEEPLRLCWVGSMFQQHKLCNYDSFRFSGNI